MNWLIKYGWYFLIVAILGEMIVPFVLALFYKGYKHRTMVISSLGNEKSPVRTAFNAWMLLAGVLFLLATPTIYKYYRAGAKWPTILLVGFIGVFAIGACIFSCFFSVNESKDVVTLASNIHGFGSAIGFMLMLFVPLLLAILSFKRSENIIGIIDAITFVLGLVSFVLFVMADKPEFQNSVIAQEGLWQRVNLFFMYLPLGLLAIKNIGWF